MQTNDTGRPGRLALGLLATGVALGLLLPAVHQPHHHHGFADQRGWLGLSCAADVLSNLVFAFMALWGAWAQTRAQPQDTTEAGLLRLLWCGLAATALGSAWYHLQPDDARLVADRLGMALAFAGLLGVWAWGRMSAAQARALALASGTWGVLSLAWWQATGNVLPWLLLQGAGLLALGLGEVAWPRQASALPVRWGWVVVAYAVAKALELGDHAVWAWTSGWVSGHTLKHLVAGLAVVPVCVALWQARGKNRLRLGSLPGTRLGWARPRRFMA